MVLAASPLFIRPGSEIAPFLKLQGIGPAKRRIT
jgi:hypothetical protein